MNTTFPLSSPHSGLFSKEFAIVHRTVTATNSSKHRRDSIAYFMVRVRVRFRDRGRVRARVRVRVRVMVGVRVRVRV